jgi:hypothetical protein
MLQQDSAATAQKIINKNMAYNQPDFPGAHQ